MPRLFYSIQFGQDLSHWVHVFALVWTLSDSPIACMHGNSGCLGVCAKPQSTGSVNRAPRKPRSRRNSHGRRIPHKDWWSSSGLDEMENNARPTQRTSLPMNPIQGNIGVDNNMANNTPFINQAVALWNENRREWVGDHPRQQPQELRNPAISWTTTYEDLLASNRRFPEPVPLPDMVDFLVDVWLQEGLYD